MELDFEKMRGPLFGQSLLVITICYYACWGDAFSMEAVPKKKATTSFNPESASTRNRINNILILDHLNINHQKGRHDWLKGFYFDFLKCAIDPRKIENIDSGRKTLWANIGANQFHLPEGKPDAQVLDGLVTLVFPDLSAVEGRLDAAQDALAGSKFQIFSVDKDSGVLVADPWGSQFRLVEGNSAENRDTRGSQPGDISEGVAMRDLTIHVPVGSNLEGIGRFYEQILGGIICGEISEKCVAIQVGPSQTLTFLANKGTMVDSHVDLRNEKVEGLPQDALSYLSNYGPHVSMYVADLPSTYKKADTLGVAYVNPRFKRRAYTLDEAVDDCMFRCIDIVDPEDASAGPILKLEHEVRSVVKRDGSKYKSCPFDEIPEGCVSL